MSDTDGAAETALSKRLRLRPDAAPNRRIEILLRKAKS